MAGDDRVSRLDVGFVMRAAQFAAQRHADQRRKGRDQEPYVNHLIEVAGHLARSARADDAVLLAAAFLHDTVEDTKTTNAEIIAHFGVDVAAVVAEVTDDKDLRKEARKRLQIERITSKSVRAQFLSIADKTANVSSIVRSPPMDWTRQRMSEYGDWAESVVTQVRGIDAYLDDAFHSALSDMRAKLR
jgi:(p)ppGpp synthase/HD superfamily hydrolase